MSSDEKESPAVTGTFTCENCHGTFDKGWSDEEAAAEAEELFPGINPGDPDEAGLVCDACFQLIMGRVRAEAPELIGDGWRGPVPEVLEDGSLLYEMTVPAGSFLAGFGKLREPPAPDSRCYRISAGMVHVRPGCRC